jgi:hypothetical protein
MTFPDPLQQAESRVAAVFAEHHWMAQHVAMNFDTALHFAKRLECADDAFAPCESIAFGYAALAELLTALQPAVDAVIEVKAIGLEAAFDAVLP